jgi:hypothetical protein
MGRRNKEAKGSMLLPHAASQLQLSTVRGTVVPLCVPQFFSNVRLCPRLSPNVLCTTLSLLCSRLAYHQVGYLAFKDLSSLDYRSFYLLHDTLLTLLPKKLTRDLLGTITP